VTVLRARLGREVCLFVVTPEDQGCGHCCSRTRRERHARPRSLAAIV
jgi:hypothetical protein